MTDMDKATRPSSTRVPDGGLEVMAVTGTRRSSYLVGKWTEEPISPLGRCLRHASARRQGPSLPVIYSEKEACAGADSRPGGPTTGEGGCAPNCVARARDALADVSTAVREAKVGVGEPEGRKQTEECLAHTAALLALFCALTAVGGRQVW